MRIEPGQPGLFAPLRHLVAEALGSKGTAMLRHEKRGAPDKGSCLDDGAQLGSIGMVTSTGSMLRPLCCTQFRKPSRTIGHPSRTTSDRRAPVNMSNASARRAFVPIGWRASNASRSVGFHRGKPPLRFALSFGTSRAGFAVTPRSKSRGSIAQRKMARSRFKRLFAASGVAALRSTRIPTAFAPKCDSGQSPKVLLAPGAIGSRNIFSTMSRVNLSVRGLSCLNSVDLKYSVANHRNVPAMARSATSSPLTCG